MQLYNKNSMRKVKFDIDENDPLSGVKCVSMVGSPAIETDFIYFNKEKDNKQFIELKSENYKKVVAGLALVPNKYILRFDGAGQEYYGYFTVESIEKIRNKFHKELLNNQVNTDHNSNDYVNAFMVESFIIDSLERLSDVQAKGIQHATLGSWFVAYKIEDAEVFQRVINGELKGFSVEIFLQQFCQVEKDETNNINNFKNEMNNILKKFKELLAEAEQKQATESKKFDRGSTAKGELIEYGAIGEPVNIVTIATDGSESLQPAPDGVYSLDSGFDVTVASGVATDIQPSQAQAKEEPKPAVVDNSELEKVKGELAKAVEDLKKANDEISKAKLEVEKLKKAPVANPVTKAEVKKETVDLSKLSNAERFRYEYGLK